MIQSVHCPSCETHYGLTRARVRPGLRRARCYRCATTFGIEGEVLLLLGAGVAMEPAPDELPAVEFDAEQLAALEDLEPLPSLEPLEPIPSLDELAPEGDLDLASLEELEAAASALEPAAEPASVEYGDVLLADDLVGAEEEILDKTLVDYPAPPHPEARPPVAPPVAPAPAAAAEAVDADPSATHGGFASARDAIDKLLGGTPPPPAAYRPPSHRGGASMDVEATLSALESTLGGVATPLPPPPPPPPAALSPSDFPSPAMSTVKLTRAEMDAAMTAMEMPATVPEPALPLAPPIAAAEPTVMLRTTPAEAPSMDPNLLKVQMGTELYSNLTMEQLVSLAEQGRLAEYHMVARQFSDNWLEASKVPGLRPVFERLRRSRLPEPPPSPMETAPIKKSLFGGLFGKN